MSRVWLVSLSQEGFVRWLETAEGQQEPPNRIEEVSILAEALEFECQKKATRIREQLSKKEVEIRHKVADIQKIKVEALKKAEEMKYSAQHDLEKISQNVMKAKSLDAEVKARLTSEISDLKSEIERKYSELRSTIADKTG